MSELIDGMSLEELEDLCSERLFSDNARMILQQKAWFLVEVLKADRAALARVEAECQYILKNADSFRRGGFIEEANQSIRIVSRIRAAMKGAADGSA